MRKIISWGLLISLCLLLTGSLLHIYAGYTKSNASGHAWGSDDAYISYRYARNFAGGQGLVFNAGERVEGYTNFLYVLLMSVIIRFFGGNNIYFFSCVLNLIFIAAALCIFYKFIKQRLGTTYAFAAGLMFALCPPLYVWTASGTESALVLLTQIALWIAAEHSIERPSPTVYSYLCFLSAVSVLLRADGFIFPCIVVLYLVLRGRPRPALFCAMTTALTFSAYTAWRYAYYGELLPNTYYAKVSGPLKARIIYAAELLSKIIFTQGLLAYFLSIVFNLVSNTKRGFKMAPTFPFLFLCGWLLYWLYIGGDHFNDRFLLIFYPLGIYTLLEYCRRSPSKRIILFLITLVMLLQLQPLCQIHLYPGLRSRYSFHKYDCWITLGKYLKEKHPGKTLATCAAGKVPYFSELRTIDMLGLNDKHIGRKKASYFSPGHNKFDADYVLSRNPDLIASWITPNLDLCWGMTKDKYLKRGYFLRYLLNSGNKSLPENIVDVKVLSLAKMQELIATGYYFAVLEKH